MWFFFPQLDPNLNNPLSTRSLVCFWPLVHLEEQKSVLNSPEGFIFPVFSIPIRARFFKCLVPKVNTTCRVHLEVWPYVFPMKISLGVSVSPLFFPHIPSWWIIPGQQPKFFFTIRLVIFG